MRFFVCAAKCLCVCVCVQSTHTHSSWFSSVPTILICQCIIDGLEKCENVQPLENLHHFLQRKNRNLAEHKPEYLALPKHVILCTIKKPHLLQPFVQLTLMSPSECSSSYTQRRWELLLDQQNGYIIQASNVLHSTKKDLLKKQQRK